MPKKILVIEDEPDILKVMVFRLKKAGYDVTSAITGKEALGLMREKKPDLMLVDYRLPDMDGLEICRCVRADEALKKTPIIIISASGGGDLSSAIKAAAVDEYIIKPFNPEELLEKIKKYL
jgi:DNA-binding response OmpR family regulator